MIASMFVLPHLPKSFESACIYQQKSLSHLLWFTKMMAGAALTAEYVEAAPNFVVVGCSCLLVPALHISTLHLRHPCCFGALWPLLSFEVAPCALRQVLKQAAVVMKLWSVLTFQCSHRMPHTSSMPVESLSGRQMASGHYALKNRLVLPIHHRPSINGTLGHTGLSCADHACGAQCPAA